ncbi:MAG: hypothetical protein ACLRSD_08590 [Oscillibacter sp.]
MKKADPRLMLIMSMTVFGTLGLFVRNIPVSSGELALYRAVLAALLIGVYLLVSRQKIPFARIKRRCRCCFSPVRRWASTGSFYLRPTAIRAFPSPH